MENVYIILPVHNRRKITERFIKCLKQQTYQNYHLILIDDGSTDGTTEMVTSYINNCSIIRGSGNLWWGGSLQKAYEWIKGNKLVSQKDIVLIINDDTEFEDDFLFKGIEILKNNPKSLLLAYCYSKQSKSLIDSGVNIYWPLLRFTQAKDSNKINCLSTRGLFLRVEDFLFIGGFHPKLLPHYLSDYEYTIRAYNKGFNLITNKNLYLYVDETTTGIHDHSQEPFRIFIKNLFSKRSTSNPIAWTMFVLLASPPIWKFPNLVLVWARTFYKIIYRFLRG